MYERLFIGNRIIRLDEVDSTNSFMRKLLSNNEKEIEGLIVITDNQYSGKGQRGNNWQSKQGENLTFSIFLKPKIEIKHQFLISKVISLGIVDFLLNKGLEHVKIKWPNDIYHKDKKLSGILIENSIKGDKIYNSIIGIGLNVNQTDFPSIITNPTSMRNAIGSEQLNLQEQFNQLLFFIEKRYLILKTGKFDLINKEYLRHLYWLNESKKFRYDNRNVEGTIVGVDSIGQLQVRVNNEVENFLLKGIEFLE